MKNKYKDHKSYKLANYTDEDNKVFNSVGSYYSSNESNITFVRDPDKLYNQYKNLLNSIGKKYSVYFKSDKSGKEREDLFSYVKDAFISLVYEYDVDSNVDFPGYVKRMLEKRVKESYSKKEKRRKEHIDVIKSPNNNVVRKLDYNQSIGNNKYYLYQGEYTEKNRKLPKEKKLIKVKVGKVSHENNQDLSMLELTDYLKNNNELTHIQYYLIYLLSKEHYSLREAKDIVCNKFGISIGDANNQVALLKKILSDFIKK